MKIKFFTVLLICCGLATVSVAQCPTTNITLDSQTAIDNFSTNYPGCTAVPIGVGITINDATPSNITNLDGLSQITYIGGYLDIRGNEALMNMDGLSELTSVGQYLYIRNNAVLTNVGGLSQLASIGQDFRIQSNPALTDVDGLNQLTFVGGEVRIIENATLMNLDGFSQITSIGEDLVIQLNPALINVDGLSQLAFIDEQLWIEGNAALTNLDGLGQITSVGQHLYVVENSVLTNVDGLGQITSIGGNHSIQGNSALTSLNGLNQLTSVGGNLVLSENPILTNVGGYSQVNFVGGNLEIQDNSQLNQCCAFCPLLAADAAQPTVIFGDININGNLTGCNSAAEINACNPCGLVSTSIPEYTSTQLNIYPNPAKNTLHFQYDSPVDEWLTFTIENSLGQQVIQGQAYASQPIQIDISGYPTGLYALNVLREDESISRLFSVSK